ncbi:MarR family transcriptional regulator [Bradyrhizobium sp. WSM 1704]|uniref:MarR family transcriptional regulator n=1 Tax=Bradyrhizobium semiaridum TaxID=2821404 RepID=UPI001CE2D03C|nr:MarR family transcriptional regulator [Bradyrhizobium semiaridum]MCA6123814.1 MarR family transcriptional regulator [Bradyrhizobium semiaridum]
MDVARESIELLGQLARLILFEETRHGLRDREWTALRFLARANRFSRTPSALASHVGTTRGTASLIINELEGRGYIEKSRSAKDKRSVTLDVTQQGKKLLARDPLNVLVNAIAQLDDDRRVGFRDTLRHALDQSDTGHQRHRADICRGCMFLKESRPSPEGGVSADFTCRLFRAAIADAETLLLCASFEQRKR